VPRRAHGGILAGSIALRSARPCAGSAVHRRVPLRAVATAEKGEARRGGSCCRPQQLARSRPLCCRRFPKLTDPVSGVRTREVLVELVARPVLVALHQMLVALGHVRARVTDVRADLRELPRCLPLRTRQPSRCCCADPSVSPCCPQPCHLSRDPSPNVSPWSGTRRVPTASFGSVGARTQCRTTGPERPFSFRAFGPAPEGGLVPPPSEGPSGATVEAAGRLSPSVQAAAPPPKAPALAQACRKRRPRSPRSPALGRTHNDGAPVLKLGQGLFSEIATFTIESGPTTPRCLARFVAAVSRDGAP
jgi:hypothetical protein